MCAELLEVLERAQIPALRIGLNPTEELSGKESAVLAGAYHPALGEMARSRLLLRKALAGLERAGLGADRAAALGGVLTITVPRGKLSQMRGQKNSNLHALQARYPASQVRIAEREGQTAAVAVGWQAE